MRAREAELSNTSWISGVCCPIIRSRCGGPARGRTRHTAFYIRPDLIRFAQSMQVRAAGRAASLPSAIGPPQRSHTW